MLHTLFYFIQQQNVLLIERGRKRGVQAILKQLTFKSFIHQFKMLDHRNSENLELA